MILFWDPRVAEWVGQRIEGGQRGFGRCRALGVLIDDRMAAGVVFHDWNPERGTIEISAAADDRRWLGRKVIRAAFGYAFDVARMAVTRTAERNEPVRKMWRAFGASEYVLADAWSPGEAMVIYTLTPAQLAASRFGGQHGKV